MLHVQHTQLLCQIKKNMRIIIIILSSIALLISGFWAYNTNFSYEPIIVFILGIVGILSHFIIKPKESEKVLAEPIGINQKVEVNLNLDTNKNNSENQIEPEKNKKTEQVSREEIIELMKPKTSILFIDDDTKFNVVKILKDAQWKKTKSTVDIKGLDIPAVKDADIFFVDINGVGKLLNCEFEGLDLALMLKEKYPKRKVVIYSANKNNNAFHKAWDLCDFKLEKNALPYQFQKLVEQYSVELHKQG